MRALARDADRDHRAGHRVAEADQPVEPLREQRLREPGAVGKQHREGDGEEGGEPGEGQAVAGEHQEAFAELGVTFAERHPQQQPGR